MSVNGTSASKGSGNARLGHPLHALTWAARIAVSHDETATICLECSQLDRS